MPTGPIRKCKVCVRRHYRQSPCCSQQCEATANQIDVAHSHDRGRRAQLITAADIEAMEETIERYRQTFTVSGIAFPLWVKRILLARRAAMEERRRMSA